MAELVDLVFCGSWIAESTMAAMSITTDMHTSVHGEGSSKFTTLVDWKSRLPRVQAQMPTVCSAAVAPEGVKGRICQVGCELQYTTSTKYKRPHPACHSSYSQADTCRSRCAIKLCAVGTSVNFSRRWLDNILFTGSPCRCHHEPYLEDSNPSTSTPLYKAAGAVHNLVISGLSKSRRTLRLFYSISTDKVSPLSVEPCR
jgi:hypothetical protein